jgi:carbamoyltransferase
VLVNTSFNGFSEPMVCSPRDAIRVFFGSGLDLLVLDRFVIRK